MVFTGPPMVEPAGLRSTALIPMTWNLNPAIQILFTRLAVHSGSQIMQVPVSLLLQTGYQQQMQAAWLLVLLPQTAIMYMCLQQTPPTMALVHCTVQLQVVLHSQ